MEKGGLRDGTAEWKVIPGSAGLHIYFLTKKGKENYVREDQRNRSRITER